MAQSPTALTLAHLREQGIPAQVVERWIPAGGMRHGLQGVRRDLFGFIDIVALTSQIVGIQCTTKKNMAARRKKILNDCTKEAMAWLECGGHIEIWGWYKQPRLRKDGTPGKLKVWAVTRQEITLADIEPIIPF